MLNNKSNKKYALGILVMALLLPTTSFASDAIKEEVDSVMSYVNEAIALSMSNYISNHTPPSSEGILSGSWSPDTSVSDNSTDTATAAKSVGSSSESKSYNYGY